MFKVQYIFLNIFILLPSYLVASDSERTELQTSILRLVDPQHEENLKNFDSDWSKNWMEIKEKSGKTGDVKCTRLRDDKRVMAQVSDGDIKKMLKKLAQINSEFSHRRQYSQAIQEGSSTLRVAPWLNRAADMMLHHWKQLPRKKQLELLASIGNTVEIPGYRILINDNESSLIFLTKSTAIIPSSASTIVVDPKKFQMIEEETNCCPKCPCTLL